jgi:hypothetical protein
LASAAISDPLSSPKIGIRRRLNAPPHESTAPVCAVPSDSPGLNFDRAQLCRLVRRLPNDPPMKPFPASTHRRSW